MSPSATILKRRSVEEVRREHPAGKQLKDQRAANSKQSRPRKKKLEVLECSRFESNKERGFNNHPKDG